MNEAGTRGRAPLATPPGSPWSLPAREAGGSRSQVAAVCTRCGAVPWDEPLGMTVTFTSIEQARQELPAWGWTVSASGDGVEQVALPRMRRPDHVLTTRRKQQEEKNEKEGGS